MHEIPLICQRCPGGWRPSGPLNLKLGDEVLIRGLWYYVQMLCDDDIYVADCSGNEFITPITSIDKARARLPRCTCDRCGRPSAGVKQRQNQGYLG